MASRFAVSSRLHPTDPEGVAAAARRLGAEAIEWRLDALRVPVARRAQAALLARLAPPGMAALYHAPYTDLEVAHKNAALARQSLGMLRTCLEALPSEGMPVFTVHVGSKGIPVEDLSWDHAVGNVRSLVQAGSARGMTVAIENLATGWTADPWAMGELCARSGARMTFDLGHCLASEPVRAGGKRITEILDDLAKFIIQAHVYGAETEEGRHGIWKDLEPMKPALRHLAQLPSFCWILDVDDADEAAQIKQQIETGAFI